MTSGRLHHWVLCLLCVLSALLLGPAQCGRQRVVSANAKLVLRANRLSALDLEVAGDLAGLPAGAVRYVTREDLLTLPQVTYTVTQDANFDQPTTIRGVSLKRLSEEIAANPSSDLVVAVSKDLYLGNYSRAYVNAHQPILVLLINGKPPDAWPKDPTGQGLNIGPYVISHPDFKPAFHVLSHSDEPQIPWGVVRLEFRDERLAFGAIAPRGPHASDAEVQDGYRIAQQNCLRCHNMADVGGQKAHRPWETLAAFASLSPDYFAAYIVNPKSKNTRAQMPGFPQYDERTTHALIAYFRTFAPPSAPGKP